MGWRGIPILAVLGVLGIARILYDPMPASAPAAEVSSTTADGTTDLSRIDFTPWLSPTAAPTTAPTTMPLADHPDDGSGSIDSAAATATNGFFRKLAVERIQWAGVGTQSNGTWALASDPFAQPAIDIDDSSAGSLFDFDSDFSGEPSRGGRGKSSRVTPAEPLSENIASANEPAYSIVGYDFAGNTPLPRPIGSLPPISVPEPCTLLLSFVLVWMHRRRRV